MYKVPRGGFLGYTYENMQNDLSIFSHIFAENIQIDSLGKTEDGRMLYHFRIGDAHAPKKALIFGGIHGREYMTSQLLMEQSAEFLMRMCKKEPDFCRELLKGKALHIVPMANPDGAAISQFGIHGLRTERLRNLVRRIAREEGGRHPAGYYFSRWKANGCGVDLNRNFDALWENYRDGRKKPSSEKYKGLKPESEIESAALAELTRREKFLYTISYHSSGEVIYWNFGQQGELLERTKDFAQRISAVTGYRMDGEWDVLDPGGYKDWAISKMGIPSLTVAIGPMESPLPGSCFREILMQNRGVFEAVLRVLSDESKEGE